MNVFLDAESLTEARACLPIPTNLMTAYPRDSGFYLPLPGISWKAPQPTQLLQGFWISGLWYLKRVEPRFIFVKGYHNVDQAGLVLSMSPRLLTCGNLNCPSFPNIGITIMYHHTWLCISLLIKHSSSSWFCLERKFYFESFVEIQICWTTYTESFVHNLETVKPDMSKKKLYGCFAYVNICTSLACQKRPEECYHLLAMEFTDNCKPMCRC